ncbi:MAG: NUDIX domain-containing protein [Patescibacteria group bacterium]
MQENTAILIVRSGTEYVLQHRDDIPTIVFPGEYSTWGGLIEPEDKTPAAGAVRELKEETGLDCAESDLIYMGQEQVIAAAPNNLNNTIILHYFALLIDENTTVECYEGQGAVTVASPYKPNPKVSTVTIAAIERYEAKTR